MGGRTGSAQGGGYEYVLLDVGVQFPGSPEVALLLLLLLDDLHGVGASAGLAAHEYDLGVVADADHAQHAEIPQGHQLSLHPIKQTTTQNLSRSRSALPPKDPLQGRQEVGWIVGVHPVACVFDAVEVVDGHLRVALLEPLEMLGAVIVGLLAVNVLHRFPPLLRVALQQVVPPDVVVSLEGQQLQVHQPRETALVFEDVGLEQRCDVLVEGVFVYFCVDCAQLLFEVDAVQLLEHVSGGLVGRILFDWVGGDVNDDHAVYAVLNGRGKVPFGELHEGQSAHRVPHQSHSLLRAVQLVVAQVLQQIVSQFGDCVGGCVRAVSVVAGVDEEGVAVLGYGLRPGDAPEVLAGAHEAVVHHQVPALAAADLNGVECDGVPNSLGEHVLYYNDNSEECITWW